MQHYEGHVHVCTHAGWWGVEGAAGVASAVRTSVAPGRAGTAESGGRCGRPPLVPVLMMC